MRADKGIPMSTSSVLAPQALGRGPYPSFGELLSPDQRRAIAARAELLGGEQLAVDLLAWLDDHDPLYRATVRVTPIDAAGETLPRSAFVNASDPIDAAYRAMRDSTAAGCRHLVEVFPGWRRDFDPADRLMRCVAAWDARCGRLTVFDEEDSQP
jgi:hypothetical protein